ncbi:Trichodiene oxygenase [Cytospora mali]|uniref:Trichodiene oxygenase n=1 Tax=Cytospora mali TaxID=578113 RepID=A0A194VRJ8_CYTMA|nr:Trichodiene oxygenase [Valsa mali]
MPLPFLDLMYLILSRLLGLVIVYHTLVAIYNITLHPLAQVPGFKLAGMTRLYQTYWCYRNGRSLYYRKVQEMHQEFGPIVRVNPNEVSVRDPRDFEKVYTVRSRYTKDPLFYRTMGVFKGMFGAVDNETHRRLRQPWIGYFSKASIVAFEETIQEKVDLLCKKAEKELVESGLIPIQGLLHALMIDVVSAFTLPECMNMLAQRPYATKYASNLLNQAGFIWIMMINDWTYHAVQAILAVYSRVFSSRSEFDKLLEKCTLIVDKYQDPAKPSQLSAKDKYGSFRRPLIESMLNRLSNGEADAGIMKREVLIDELYSFNLAAAFNFGTGMSITLYHILSNKTILQKLRFELLGAFPDGDYRITHSVAGKLPYLTACIQEGNRLSYGPIGRLPRIVPEGGETFQGYHIPAGCTVGTWSYVQHHNPEIWGDDHDTFNPDRWLDPERARFMTRHLLTFGKDHRHCIGKELASTTMYVCLANLIRRFPDLEVYGDYPADDLNDNFATVIPREAERMMLRQAAPIFTT